MGLIQGKIPMRIKLIHGFGAVAFGVKDGGFLFFLLFYYSQVLGMDAGLVGLILLAALLIDAVVDPIIGYLSDRTYTRWGRRLPWLYAAPIPLAFMWLFLWSPPGGVAPSPLGLLGIMVAVRLFLSACEVPSVSLVPELTSDYQERTTLFRYRYLSGWMGGIVMMVLAYTVFMPGENGLLDQKGYPAYGLFGAILMAIAVLGSAIGQHHIVANLPETKPAPFSLRDAFSEIFEAFSEKAFLIFAAGGLAAYVSQGMTFSISNFLNIYIWQLDRVSFDWAPAWLNGLTAYPFILGVSVVGMFMLVGPMHNRLGKPKSAAVSAIIAIAFGLLPYFLFLGGLWPAIPSLGSTVLFFAFTIIANMFGVVLMISATSMLAEIVEAFEERTGRRAEGSFYSGNWLVQKCATGFGAAITGQIIGYSQLEQGADPATVEFSVLSTIIIAFAVATIVLGLIAAFWLGRFPITREQHEARIAAREAQIGVQKA
ncbi:MFS transporter [Qipengyuania sp. S6317L1]|uniref:MFS transporter n=1 Tax=Qipengyuania sp. S6317L1 TaxID=2926410 RepID=UPI001FF3EADE|nr:MFS transporter [Qipengyuania sp. S6317L1]MCK0098366.1 MFS transporter [Qipengyuania sp. S6317L1]